MNTYLAEIEVTVKVKVLVKAESYGAAEVEAETLDPYALVSTQKKVQLSNAEVADVLGLVKG